MGKRKANARPLVKYLLPVALVAVLANGVVGVELLREAKRAEAVANRGLEVEVAYVACAEVAGPPSYARGVCPEEVSEPFFRRGVLVVNKKHPLPRDFAPGENAEARRQLDALVRLARANGVNVSFSYSGFRSFATQRQVYNSWVARRGRVIAETFSMRAGFSEHQTGLAFDLRHNNGQLYRNGDPTYDQRTDFIAQHAHQFGFIVRYRSEWQAITGIIGEPWHLRYLGEELATSVFQADLPLELYLGVAGGDYLCER